MKKYKVILFCAVCLAILGMYQTRYKKLYDGYHYNIESQEKVLKEFLSKKYGDKYKLYTAHFNKNDEVPNIGKQQKKTILWLGRQQIKITKEILDNIKKFDIVLVSDFNKIAILNIIGVSKKAQFPVFTENEKIESTKDYYAVLGRPAYAINVIRKNKLEYKTYNFAKIDTLKQSLNKVKAIIVEQDMEDNYDMDPVLLQALNSGIPIIEEKRNYKSDSQALVGQIVKYYYDEKELTDIIKEIEKNNGSKSYNKDVEWINQYFTKKSALDRLQNILDEKSEEISSSLINFDIRGNTGYHINGDIWLTNDLLKKMERKEFEYIITFADTVFRPKTVQSIFVRGKIDDIIDKIVSPKNILWIAYPDENNKKTNEIKITFEEYIDEFAKISPYFEKIAVSSKKIQEALKKIGVETIWEPQFTNTEKFYPDYNEDKKSEILFVGNSHFKRKSAIYAKNHNLPITIYGKWWPKGWAKADYIDNRILRKYYSSAKIVLNDQLRSMKEFGVISNRIYDVTACKTMVISEYMPEIEEIYGDCVPTWKTEEELISLIKHYLSHDEERKQKAECAYKITLQHFTSEKIAKDFEKIIQEIQKE